MGRRDVRTAECVGGQPQRERLRRCQRHTAPGPEVDQPVQLPAGEHALLPGPLYLHEIAGAGADDVHVHVGDHVLLVAQVQPRLAADDADADRRHRPVQRLARLAAQGVLRGEPADRVVQRHVRAGDRRGPGAAVGLQDVEVQHDRVLPERGEVQARAQAAVDQAGDFGGTYTDLALHALPLGAGGRGTGQHRVLGGDPAEPGALTPAGYPFGDAGRTQHPGRAELDKHRPFRVRAPLPGRGDRHQLVGAASIRSGHGVSLTGPPRARSAGPVSRGAASSSRSACPRSPYHHSATAMPARYGTRSRDRSTAQRVPFVASQPSCARRVGWALEGSRAGRRSSGTPSRAAYEWATSRCPRSLGCNRSTLPLRPSYVAGCPTTSKCTVPNRWAIRSATVFTARIRRARGRASVPGNPNIRPGSGNRMVSAVAPAAVSAPTVCASAAPTRDGSKLCRRVSLTPTTTAARSGRSSSARGSCSRSTSAVNAPLTARLTRSASSAGARIAAQPRQVPSGNGSPIPTVMESPSAMNVLTPRPPGR